jgi:Substrate binding domain of ABC-type glycine betaine transport system
LNVADTAHSEGPRAFAQAAELELRGLCKRFAATLNKVGALLTIKAIQRMNAAVSIDKQSAASVARQFLAANGLG